MGNYDWAATISAGALQALAIGGGLIYAAKQVKVTAQQNRDAERWRQTEFAMSLMERISKDEELSLCARALDWADGPIVVPSRYRVMFFDARADTAIKSPRSSSADVDGDPSNPSSDGLNIPSFADRWGTPKSDTLFRHNWGILARAVLPDPHRHWSDPRMLVYRYCFDAFGGYLEMIQRHLCLRNIARAHLFGLRYYLDLLNEPIYYDLLPEGQRLRGVPATEVFRPFMRKYYPDGWHLVEDRHRLPGGPDRDRGT